MIITIDGPTASGKSTIAVGLAQQLGFIHVSSGMIYRAIGYILLQDFSYTCDTIALVDPADISKIVEKNDLRYYRDSQQQINILYNGINLTAYLKSPMIDQAASIVATNQHVRHAVNRMLYNLSYDENIVIDGRDTGSVVFPDAQVKFYLTASAMVRAQRWQASQKLHGKIFSSQEAYEQITRRDQRDVTRSTAPLVVPSGAIIVDNSALSIDQTLKTLISHIPMHE